MLTSAGPVLIRYPNGQTATQPAYDTTELRKIIKYGDGNLADMTRLGTLPDYRHDAYIPDTYEER